MVEDERVEFIKHCVETIKRDCYQHGREDMRDDIIDMIRPCLPRDASLQKIIKAIEGLE